MSSMQQGEVGQAIHCLIRCLALVGMHLADAEDRIFVWTFKSHWKSCIMVLLSRLISRDVYYVNHVVVLVQRVVRQSSAHIVRAEDRYYQYSSWHLDSMCRRNNHVPTVKGQVR